MSNFYKQNNNNLYTENRELIISVQENERQRIARDLHDASLQSLTHVIHQLELCNLYMDKDSTKAKLELLNASKNLKTVIDEIRNVVFDLHPMSFDDFGLKQTYEIFFDALRKYTSFEFDIVIDDIKNNSNFFLLSIYRIGKECVMNSIRHSKGSRVIFKCLEKKDSIHLFIQDNGIGITEKDVYEKTNHYGLKVIYERVKILGGTIDIKNDCGTRIIMEFPIIRDNK